MNHLKTRSTGTVHGTDGHGKALCPVKAGTAMDATTEPVTCRRCIALAVEDQAVEVDDHQEPGDFGLTEEQRDGIACVRCHNTTNPMEPVGMHNGVQLFGCLDCNADPRDAYLDGLMRGLAEPDVTRPQLHLGAALALSMIRDETPKQPLFVSTEQHGLLVLTSAGGRFVFSAVAKVNSPTNGDDLMRETAELAREFHRGLADTYIPRLEHVSRCPWGVPWCRTRHDRPGSAHEADLETIDLDPGAVGVVMLRAVEADPARTVVRIHHGPDGEPPACLDLDPAVAAELGEVIASLPIHGVDEFAAALRRGGQLLATEAGR